MAHDSRSPRKTNPARVMAAVVMSLLIGALVNVGVAWGLATWLPQRGWNCECATQADVVRWREVLVHSYQARGAARSTWDQSPLSRPFQQTPFAYAIANPKPAVHMENVGALPCLSWGRTRAVLGFPEAATLLGSDHATGWPALCLWYGINLRASRFEIDGGLPLKRSYVVPQTPLSQVRALPLHPIWPGFALNTLFYAAVAWLLWRLPILSRRHRRRIRGQCLRCAYNRAGLAPTAPCPECGHTPFPSLSAASA